MPDPTFNRELDELAHATPRAARPTPAEIRRAGTQRRLRRRAVQAAVIVVALALLAGAGWLVSRQWDDRISPAGTPTAAPTGQPATPAPSTPTVSTTPPPPSAPPAPAQVLGGPERTCEVPLPAEWAAALTPAAGGQPGLKPTLVAASSAGNLMLERQFAAADDNAKLAAPGPQRIGTGALRLERPDGSSQVVATFDRTEVLRGAALADDGRVALLVAKPGTGALAPDESAELWWGKPGEWRRVPAAVGTMVPVPDQTVAVVAGKVWWPEGRKLRSLDVASGALSSYELPVEGRLYWLDERLVILPHDVSQVPIEKRFVFDPATGRTSEVAMGERRLDVAAATGDRYVQTAESSTGDAALEGGDPAAAGLAELFVNPVPGTSDRVLGAWGGFVVTSSAVVDLRSGSYALWNAGGATPTIGVVGDRLAVASVQGNASDYPSQATYGLRLTSASRLPALAACPSPTSAPSATQEPAPATLAPATTAPAPSATTQASSPAPTTSGQTCLAAAGLCFTVPRGVTASHTAAATGVDEKLTFSRGGAQVADVTMLVGGLGGVCQPGLRPAATVVKVVKTAVTGLPTNVNTVPDLYAVQAVIPTVDGTFEAAAFLTNGKRLLQPGDVEACDALWGKVVTLADPSTGGGATKSMASNLAPTTVRATRQEALAMLAGAEQQAAFDIFASATRG